MHSHGTISHRRHDLPELLRPHVANGINTGNAGGRIFSRDDVSGIVQKQLILQ